MNKFINWCCLLTLLCGHENACAYTDEFLNQKNFVKILESNQETFDQFDSPSYRKWMSYFLVYGSDEPKKIVKSLEAFKNRICGQSAQNQENECKNMFVHMKNTIKNTKMMKTLQNTMMKFSKYPDQKESFFKKIAEQNKKSAQPHVTEPLTQDIQTEQNKAAQESTSTFSWFSNAFNRLKQRFSR
jgi:hypothetical protein